MENTESNQQQFDEVFEKILLPELEKIEPLRLKASIILKWISRGTAILFLIAIYLFIREGASETFVGVLMAAIFIGFGSMVLFKSNANDYFHFEDKFKEEIVPAIVGLIAQEINYRPMQHVSTNRVIASRLIAGGGSSLKVNGSDFLSASYHNVPIMMSYILAKDAGENGQTFFNGIFFVADFKKDFKGSVVLLPNLTKKNSPSFMTRMMGKGRSDNYVQLEDTDFAKEFICYASDDILARYILSYSFKDKLLDYKKKHPFDFVFFSFVDGSVYVVIDHKRNPFLPSIHKSLLDKAHIKNIYEELLLVFEITSILELDERLWSKT